MALTFNKVLIDLIDLLIKTKLLSSGNWMHVSNTPTYNFVSSHVLAFIKGALSQQRPNAEKVKNALIQKSF